MGCIDLGLVVTPARQSEKNNDVSEQFRRFLLTVLVFVFSAPLVLATDENSGIREISDSVYSFTLGEGNHPMFVIGDDGVAAKAIRPALPK
jgi:hypothetical protein